MGRHGFGNHELSQAIGRWHALRLFLTAHGKLMVPALRISLESQSRDSECPALDSFQGRGSWAVWIPVGFFLTSSYFKTLNELIKASLVELYFLASVLTATKT